MMTEATDLGPLVVFGTIWLVCGMIGGFGCAHFIKQWDDTWDEIADMWRTVPMMGPMMLVAVFDCRRRAKRHAAESATPHQHGAGNGEKHGG